MLGLDKSRIDQNYNLMFVNVSEVFIIQFVGDHVLGMMVSPKCACDS